MVANALMKKNPILLVATIALGHFLATYVGSIYVAHFRLYGGFFSLPLETNKYLHGVAGSYLFFLFLLFTAFGEGKKYKWIWIASIPGILLVLVDFSHIYFHLLFPLIGWLIGWGIGKLISSRNKSTV